MSEPTRDAAQAANVEKFVAPKVETTHDDAEAEISLDELREKNTLQIEAKGNFSPLLEALNSNRGDKPLTPRPEGFHVTVFGPADHDAIKKLDDAGVSELRTIASQIGRGEGVTVQGIGFIDASTEPNLVDKDSGKSVAFLALDIPALQAFREKAKLPPKDFHITLGYNGGDIHFRQQVGPDGQPRTEIATNPDGTPKKGAKEKPVTEFVPKKADQILTEKFGSLVPTLEFQGIGGKEKQQAQELPNEMLAAELQAKLLADSEINAWEIKPATVQGFVGEVRNQPAKTEKTVDALVAEFKEKNRPKLLKGEVIGELVKFLNQNGLGKSIGEIKGKLGALGAGTSREDVVSLVESFGIAPEQKHALEQWLEGKGVFNS